MLVGHKWQYYDKLADQLAASPPIRNNDSDPEGGVEWNEEPGSRYFIEVHADRPYCGKFCTSARPLNRSCTNFI